MNASLTAWVESAAEQAAAVEMLVGMLAGSAVRAVAAVVKAVSVAGQLVSILVGGPRCTPPRVSYTVEPSGAVPIDGACHQVVHVADRGPDLQSTRLRQSAGLTPSACCQSTLSG